jgi:hypothetical protein
MVQVEVRLVEV